MLYRLFKYFVQNISEDIMWSWEQRFERSIPSNEAFCVAISRIRSRVWIAFCVPTWSLRAICLIYLAAIVDVNQNRLVLV